MEQVLYQRLRWMVRLRWLVAAGIFATVVLADRITAVEYAKAPLYFIVVFILFYNLVLDYRLHRLSEQRRRLLFYANLQIGLDILALILLVAFTGGVQNLFVFYAVFHVAIGSILLPRKNVIAVTICICAAVLALFWLDYLGAIPSRYRLHNFIPGAMHENPTYVFGLSYIFVTLLAVTAYMAVTVSGSLKDAQRRLLSMTRDSEEQRALFEKQNRELLSLERQKDHFLELASGNLRGALESIRGISSNLIETGVEGPREAVVRELIKVRNQAEVLIEMVGDMRETERLRKLEWDLAAEEVDLGAAARRAVVEMTSIAEQKSVSLNVKIAEGLPCITGDSRAWPSVFKNLLENAISYSPPHSLVEFRLDRDWQGENIYAEVKDQGMGIRAEDLPRVFEEFHRSGGADMISSGTGMGLAIARRVVELHGGSIRASSRPGRGSTFQLTLPIK
ncbi:MAG: HAMP domain-containing sensor histidine kinase [bacterium]